MGLLNAMRLRLWLAAHDVAELFRLPYRVQFWFLMRAASAVDYEPIVVPDHGMEPF